MIDAFDSLDRKIRKTVQELFDGLIVQNGKVDLMAMGVQSLSTKRTYLVSDGMETAGMFVSPDIAGFVNLPFYLAYLGAELFHRRGKKPY